MRTIASSGAASEIGGEKKRIGASSPLLDAARMGGPFAQADAEAAIVVRQAA
jgi:hypothetical protein